MPDHNEQRTPMELLAPAGSFSAFKAALEEGADAIYIGAPNLNARALARDFTYPEIDGLVREAHKAGVRVYIAMNSLMKENEISLAVEGLAMFEKIGPDALIIQDLGLFLLARDHFPMLPLHASTLMTAHNSPAVNRLAAMGFKRVVLPRELTLEEIREIHDRTGVELEVFVHGAMCFSYSGLCLFSSMHGGKSSLRGQCVQPCRRRYAWQTKKGRVKQGKQSEKDGGYLFSMNDLCGIDLIPQLQAAGVSCLKIEGRLKSAEYVRKTVRAYRLMLDDPGDAGQERARKKEAQRYLDEAMGRRRSTGFFLSSKPGDAVTPSLTGNIGQPVGKIVQYEEIRGKEGVRQTTISIELSQRIQAGDRLRLHDERSGERAAFTLRTLQKGSRFIDHAVGGEKVQAVVKGGLLRPGKGPFRGSLFKVDVGSGRGEEEQAKSLLLGRVSRPVEPDRRKIEHVLKTVAAEERAAGSRSRSGKGYRLPVWVQIRSLRDRQYRLPVAVAKYVVPVERENLDLLRSAPAKLRQQDRDLIWSLPPVIEEERLPRYIKMIGILLDEGFRGFQLGHFSQGELFDELSPAGGEVQLFTNYTCNVLNSLALHTFAGTGFAGIQFSLETDETNLAQALRNFHSSLSHTQGVASSPKIGMYVYGRPPLFTSRLDDFRYQYSKRFVSPRGELFVLERGEGVVHAVPVAPFSLLGMLKEIDQCGIDYLVADLASGNMKRNIQEFTGLLKRGSDIQVLSGNFRTGLL